MKVAVVAESDPGEPRVAATPETVKKMIALGTEVVVEYMRIYNGEWVDLLEVG